MKVRGRIELLIVVDAEIPWRRAEQDATGRRRRVNRIRVRHHDERGEAAVLDEINATGEAVNPGMIQATGNTIGVLNSTLKS